MALSTWLSLVDRFLVVFFCSLTVLSFTESEAACDFWMDPMQSFLKFWPVVDRCWLWRSQSFRVIFLEPCDSWVGGFT